MLYTLCDKKNRPGKTLWSPGLNELPNFLLNGSTQYETSFSIIKNVGKID